ncbi:MAG: hypothetical protein KME16_02025 [Scytolyngbya sp. HA4215-MV1]|jgi:hypothetical protein|nr:hypothetical protein [Scytolyngbya sp. HA4215-MV1]
MDWELSKFRAGDLVEVLTESEILQTLDEHGCFDGMPFMPEMLQFCGQQLRVSAVAHKTCDTARQTWTGRRLNRTVHLTEARCSGSAHGGCEAECLIFWKDAWLKAVDPMIQLPPSQRTMTRTGSISNADLARLTRMTQPDVSDEERFSCQATRMWDATSELHPLDIRQYVYDVITHNHSIGRVLRVTWIAMLRFHVSRGTLSRVPFVQPLIRSLLEVTHRLLTGRKPPYLNPAIKPGEKTPIDDGSIGLSEGDYVRIKSQSEIEKTLDYRGMNRGLSFDREEMAPHCGKIVRVKKVVKKIIDEPSGKMITMKYPCIMLDGVVCNSEYASCRINCPRQIYAYWREFWLEPVDSSIARTHLAKRH